MEIYSYHILCWVKNNYKVLREISFLSFERDGIHITTKFKEIISNDKNI